MEGRLSVKQHCVSVHHVSMNHVAVFQINGVSVDVSQRDINAVSAFQYFSTRKVSGPFFISIARKSRFMSLTVTGFVRFIAILWERRVVL
jgi:hypothetical protein